MKRENKKALTATRNANRARAISNLQASNAKLRKELADAHAEIAKLKAAQS